MQLQNGDWVRTEEGKEGKVVLVSRQTAFVEIWEGNTRKQYSYLLSQLTKIAPPQEENQQSPATH